MQHPTQLLSADDLDIDVACVIQPQLISLVDVARVGLEHGGRDQDEPRRSEAARWQRWPSRSRRTRYSLTAARICVGVSCW
jgi:hypothetical protein